MDPSEWGELMAWAAVNKGMTALLLQFVRARPSEKNEGIHEAFQLIKRTARWRVMHEVGISVFDRVYGTWASEANPPKNPTQPNPTPQPNPTQPSHPPTCRQTTPQ